MHLEQLEFLLPLPDGVVDDEDVVAEVLQLWPLPKFTRVLQRQRMEPEQLAERHHVVVARRHEVEPEELVPLTQAIELSAVEAGEDAHLGAR